MAFHPRLTDEETEARRALWSFQGAYSMFRGFYWQAPSPAGKSWKQHPDETSELPASTLASTYNTNQTLSMLC